MPKTPDRFPGEREDEGLYLAPGAAEPIRDGDLYYVDGKGFRFQEAGYVRGLIDSLLETDPDSGNTTYAVTYDANKVILETWTVASSGKTIKTVAYTYVGSKIETEVRKVYAADGATIVAQQSITYGYAGSRISGYASTRDV
jgi:hypothetical protein